ncbi:MAG: hypothetical protein NVSMB9_16430 [Isosphaeraceae bacterium]
MPSLSRPHAWLPLGFSLILAFSTLARGEGTADCLLRLVPRDASVTIAVEDLRGNSRALAGSPLAEELRRLPVVKTWMASNGFLGLQQALDRAQKVLGENLATLRDEMLGEAFVLTLRLPPGARPDEARGLLLVRVPNRGLLDRLLEGLNASTSKGSERPRVSKRTRGGTTYHVREFPPGPRPDEFYALLKDRVFAWSNSEALLHGVIDGQADGSRGLDGVDGFQKVRGLLPGHALASLFVDPRFVERLLAAAPRARDAGESRVLALFGQYLAAVRYAGVALEWRDGFVIHTEEVVDPAKIGPGLKRWAGRTGSPSSTIPRLPSNVLAAGNLHLDFEVLIDGLRQLVPEEDQVKIDNLFLALDGLLLGLATRTEVLPRLGPHVLVYLEPNDPDEPAWKPSTVLSIELGEGPGSAKVVAALETGLRTLLVLHALDPSHGGGRLRVESRTDGRTKVTTLNAQTPLAFALPSGRLILGTSAAAVTRALAARSDPNGGQNFPPLQTPSFSKNVSFVCADLRALHAFLLRHRSDLARHTAETQKRTEAEAAHDLDQALSLMNLFDLAFLTSSVEPDFHAIHRSLGLVKTRAGRP